MKILLKKVGMAKVGKIALGLLLGSTWSLVSIAAENETTGENSQSSCEAKSDQKVKADDSSDVSSSPETKGSHSGSAADKSASKKD